MSKKSSTMAIFGSCSILVLAAAASASDVNNQAISVKYHNIDIPLAAGQGASFDDRWSGDGVSFAPLSPTALSVDEAPHTAPLRRNQKGYIDDAKKVSVPVAASRIVQNPSECGPSSLSPIEVEALVRETARKFEVDEELAAAISWTESRFDQDRNSPAGARGAMQLMPDTAVRFGVTDICDTPQNIEGGVKFLRSLLQEFPNPFLAIAAYNSGENRVYQYGGIPPFPETVSYVSKVFNRQLGAEAPKPKSGSAPKQLPAAKTDGEASGVIPVNKNGKFVAGIMHF